MGSREEQPLARTVQGCVVSDRATVTLSFNRGRVDFYSESYLVGHHAEDRIVSFIREDWIKNLEHDINEYATRGLPR